MIPVKKEGADYSGGVPIKWPERIMQAEKALVAGSPYTQRLCCIALDVLWREMPQDVAALVENEWRQFVLLQWGFQMDYRPC